MDDKEKEKAIKTLRKNVAYIEKMQPDSHGVVIAIPLHGSPDEIEGKVGKISAELKASVESFLPAGSADPEDENAKFKIYLHKRAAFSLIKRLLKQGQYLKLLLPVLSIRIPLLQEQMK